MDEEEEVDTAVKIRYPNRQRQKNKNIRTTIPGEKVRR